MEHSRERGRSSNMRHNSREPYENPSRSRSLSRDPNQVDRRQPRSASQIRVPNLFHRKKTDALIVPPAPKDICPTLKKGFLCDSKFCKKDHQLDSLNDHELLLLIARRTCGIIESNSQITSPKDMRLANPTAEDFSQGNSPKLTLAVLLQIAEHWATRDLRQIEDSKLRALLTLCAVLTRKFSKSQLGLLCETHLRHEGLGQDQADSVLEVYQRLHSDKGGNFEAALWQQWDRQSLIMFISAFLNIALQTPCESSSVVVSGLATLYPAQDNSTLSEATNDTTWSSTVE
uniref:Transcriptional activator VP30 n=1 Tax=Reston ebolavirus TaxID=186539 RepID=A0A1Y0K5D8_9MONO|nr:VP30 [Reston ebolavirus]ARU80333.1 VP30 [Reston ebolavirus]